MRATRAWVYVLSVAAVLVPAGGIAYLGAVSYRDERGAVAAQLEQQREAAAEVSARLDRAITAALAAADHARAHGEPVALPLARYWFWIDANHQVRVPGLPIDPAPAATTLDRGAACSPGRQLEDCIHEAATRKSRLAALHLAQRAESCRGDVCAASLADARRGYQVLSAADDTGPDALLGLARVLARQGDPHAAAPLAELDRRFGDRSFEGMPVPLVTATVRAAGDPDALLAIADRVLAGDFAIAVAARVGVLDHVRARVVEPLTATQAQRRAALGERIAELRVHARAVAGLAPDAVELVRTASAAWRAHVATRAPGRVLLYRTVGAVGDGVVGLAVDTDMLAAAVSEPRGASTRAVVLLPGASPDPALRTLAQVPLGTSLSLALVNPTSEPDPLDAIIRQRARRHVILTSALALALGFGLLATIRGAARARELAQLKSDFVSTVSHELKTPLTSIRMFAEMLEQGVARGDPDKMARYHGVIVQESQRLGLLIANLLDYAQIERGTRRYTAVRQPIGALARHAVATFETLRDGEAPRNAIAVAVSSEAMHAEIEVDRDVLVQAVLNLLANAAKYGQGATEPVDGRGLPPAGSAAEPRRGSIDVAIGADRERAWISVTDHGPGIPAGEHDRIFREFYRAPEAYRSGVEGTGLGLALVKRHVEAFGGTVAVASVIGEGATFTIRLPRAGGLA